MRVKLKTIIQCFIACFFVFFSGSLLSGDPGCRDARIMSEKIFTDVCWSCTLPILVAGLPISGGGYLPEEFVNEPLCLCEDNNGVAMPGVTTSMWEPSRLVELQRVPGCFSSFGGVQLDMDKAFRGQHGNGDHDGGDGSFMHYRYYSFPVLQIMDLFVNRQCFDAYTDLEILNFSELDATWSSSLMAFFMVPESAAFTNPAALVACAADSIAANTGRSLKQLFWCAGSWGSIYPLSGMQVTKNILTDSSLLTTRVLAKHHRLGMALKTMGDDAMCRGLLSPTMPKQQYKFTMLHPVPETDSSHVIGESILKWGTGRIIPVVGEDPIYMIWRWNDCCNS